MNAELNKNVKLVHKLNKKAEAGSLKSFEVQLQIGKLCAEGYKEWKSVPKKGYLLS